MPIPAPATLSDAENRALSADLHLRALEVDGTVPSGNTDEFRAWKDAYMRAWHALSDAERERVTSVIRYRNREGL